MTVTIENLGGGKGMPNLPIKDLEPLLTFRDDFTRPPGAAVPEIPCSGLSTNWIVQWLTAEETTSPIRPTITLDGQCAFVSAESNIVGVTHCTPSDIAWFGRYGFPGSQQFAQFAEMRMTENPGTQGWQTYVMCCWTMNPGTTAYEPGCQSQPGFFFMSFGPHPGAATSGWLGYGNISGITLSPTPGILFNYFVQLPDADLGTMKRLEARWDPSISQWHLRCLFDGVEVLQFTSGAVFVGAPAMGCSMSSTTNDSSPIAKVDDFTCGWLRS